jgi:SecD/SecF fusion protein
MIFGGATLQDFAFAMLVGIASGTYSSIFIASPVLTAWKEREPGFVRRRLRIAEDGGGKVPAYADEIEMAKLQRDDETEANAAARHEEAAAAEAAPEAVATAERPEETGNGGSSRDNGDTDSAEAASAERRQRNAERRARRQARRKHGRGR